MVSLSGDVCSCQPCAVRTCTTNKSAQQRAQCGGASQQRLHSWSYSRGFRVVARSTLCPGLETADLQKVFADALCSGRVVPLELVGRGGQEAVPDAVFEHGARGLRPDEGDRVCNAESRCMECEASDRAVQGSTGSGRRQDTEAVAAKALLASLGMEPVAFAKRLEQANGTGFRA